MDKRDIPPAELTVEKAKAVLSYAFTKALSRPELENLIFHANKGSGIACGPDANYYINKEGFG